MENYQIAQSVLATAGVGPCWVVVAFLTENKIYIDHLTSLQLPDNASYCSAQTALETMVKRLYEAIGRANENLKIKYVCLFGGKYQPNDYLSNLCFIEGWTTSRSVTKMIISTAKMPFGSKMVVSYTRND
jgi:hypothetical protein